MDPTNTVPTNTVPANTVLLPTTVVGSYSVPEWLERLKTEYYQRRISAQHMAEINEVAIMAAVKTLATNRVRTGKRIMNVSLRA